MGVEWQQRVLASIKREALGGLVGGFDCKAEMGGLLISTPQYDAAAGRGAECSGNENGQSGRLMAHKDRAFRRDGSLNLDSGD